MSKRIVSFVLVFVIIFLMVPLASADYTNTSFSMWDQDLMAAVNGVDSLTGGTVGAFIGRFAGPICPTSSDGYHHTPTLHGCSTGENEHGLYANATCQYCGQSFKAYSSELKAAYEKQVDDLPVNGISSDGSFLWYPTFRDLIPVGLSDSEGNVTYVYRIGVSMYYGSYRYVDLPVDGTPVVYQKVTYSQGADGRSIYVSASPSGSTVSFGYAMSYVRHMYVPVTGMYFLQDSTAYSFIYSDHSTSSIVSVNGAFESSSSGVHYSKDGSINAPSVYSQVGASANYIIGTIYFPVYRVVPDVVSGETDSFSQYYASNTRMGNIGGNYGTINNDNSVTQYTTQYIVNETNNTYTNPATGETQTITDWTYNYDNRSYTLTLEGGDTTTVTYGDENVTITENTVNNEGDTITNNYTIYYVVNNGSTDPDPSPSSTPGGPSIVTPSTVSRVFRNYRAVITQAYGTDGHGGTDCIPSSGVADTVIAHSDGEVVWVQTGQDNDQGSTGNASYGNAVKIQHANGYYTLYAHLSTVEVAQGDHVSKGQALGMMGNTGNSYGAHLHFEVRDATDTRINSDPYINADLPGLPTVGDTSWWSDAMGRLGAILGAPFVAELFSTVGGVFGQMWGWLPPEIAAVFTVGVTFLVIAAVMKFFL